ncbi:F-box domain containing protein [Tanacetum coccineum]
MCKSAGNSGGKGDRCQSRFSKDTFVEDGTGVGGSGVLDKEEIMKLLEEEERDEVEWQDDDNKDLVFVLVCNTSRWQKTSNTPGKEVPKNVLRYFSIISRLQCLYKSSHTAKDMIWHATGKCTEPGKMQHPVDGGAWKKFDTNKICSATLMEDDMLKAQIKVVDILCELELIYPPALFDIMVHLVIHLPIEALEGGPIRPRWMYPFERYMKKLKVYFLTRNMQEEFPMVWVADPSTSRNTDKAQRLGQPAKYFALLMDTSMDSYLRCRLQMLARPTKVTVAVMIVPISVTTHGCGGCFANTKVNVKPYFGPTQGSGHAVYLQTRPENLLLMEIAVLDKGQSVSNFEQGDKQTLNPLDPYAAHWSNYIGEVIRSVPLYYPSWEKVPKERKATIISEIGTLFDLRPHMDSSRWTEIYEGINMHLQKAYNTNKASFKAKHWKADPTTGTYDVEAIRRARPEEITAAEWDKYIKFWNDPKNLARAA